MKKSIKIISIIFLFQIITFYTFLFLCYGWFYYRTLETGDVSYWYKQSEEDIPKEFLENNEIISGIFENKTWLESRAYKYHFEPALFDYMGVFEIAYKMIKKHELSWSNFKMSYLYRN